MYILLRAAVLSSIMATQASRRMPEEMIHTTLSRKLKTLEEEGLIIRTEYQQIPPKVEYYLSEIGKKFKKVLAVLEVWGNEYIDFLNAKGDIGEQAKRSDSP